MPDRIPTGSPASPFDGGEAALERNDIVGWIVAHPFISSAVVILVVAGWLMSLAEHFPRFAPVARAIGYILAIIVGGFVLLVWIMPEIDEAIFGHSRLENTASIIAILLALILWAMWRVIEVLRQIRATLERDR
jgi:hypothetical protein